MPELWQEVSPVIPGGNNQLTPSQMQQITALVNGAGLNVVALGDSITARNYALGTGNSTQAQWNSQGYLAWAQVFSTSRVNVLGISGHAGAAITAPLNGQLPLVQYIATDLAPLASNIDAAIFMGGVNDIDTIIVTDAVLIAGFRVIYAALRALAKRVIACTIMPTTAASAAQNAQIARINDFIRAECRLYQSMYCCDMAQAVIDPQTGLLISGFSTDGLHPSARMAARMGQYLASIFNLWPSATETDMSGHPFDTLVATANPLAQGANASGTNGWNATGTATGTGPATWTGNGLNTATIAFTGGQTYPANYRRQGNGLGFSFTAAANSDSFRVFPAQANGGAGDVYLERAWGGTSARTFGAINIPSAGPNGFLYKCVTYPGGVTGGAEPTWPTTVGQQVVDGSVTWVCIEKINAGDLVVFEADIYFTATTGRLAPSLETQFFENSFAGNLRPSTMNLGVANVLVQSIIQAPLYSAGDAQIDAASPQTLPLNQVLRLVSPQMVVPALCTHIIPCFRLFGESGATATGQVLRAEMKKIKVW